MTTTDRISERLPGWSRPWSEVAVRTVVDAFDDRVPGLSAEVAFYTILSLPPLLLTLVSTLGVIDQWLAVDLRDAVVTGTTDWAGAILSDEATERLSETVDRVFRSGTGSIASIGFAVTVFSASRALRVLTVAISIAYDLEDTRATWHQFVYGIALTIGVMLVGMLFVPAFVAGPQLGETIAEFVELGDEFAAVWRVAYWPTAAVLATALLSTLYHVAAPWWTPWRRDYPGAVLAMVVALLGTVALRVYTGLGLGSDLEVFRGLATLLVVLLWIYVTAFGILLGAELNAEIEKMWPTSEGPLPTDGSVGETTGSQGDSWDDK